VVGAVDIGKRREAGREQEVESQKLKVKSRRGRTNHSSAEAITKVLEGIQSFSVFHSNTVDSLSITGANFFVCDPASCKELK